MADVLHHPIGDQELRQLGQAPRRKRQPMVTGVGLRDLLNLAALREGELRRPSALVLRIQRAEPIGVEVTDDVADPVFAGERHARDRGHVHALRGQQHHLRPPPGHHRPRPPPHDPQ
jgi:hypothetical protein